MMRRLLPILLCLIAVTADARCQGADYRDYLTPAQKQKFDQTVARIPYATGNHWIATKGGRTLNIVGTKHTGDARMSRIVQRLQPIIADADALLLEVASHEVDEAYEDPKVFQKYMLLPKGQSLSSMMSASTWAALSRRVGIQGISAAELDRLQPWFASELLDDVVCASSHPRVRRKGLDDRIERVARRNRVPIGSLETPGQALGAMLQIPNSHHVRFMELELARQSTGKITYNELDDAYFEEKIGEIMVISRWSMYTDFQASRSELDRLYDSLNSAILKQRNRNWMPVLLRTKGQNIVVAVGAAHLPGKDGILTLLKRQGYTITRAPF